MRETRTLIRVQLANALATPGLQGLSFSNKDHRISEEGQDVIIRTKDQSMEARVDRSLVAGRFYSVEKVQERQVDPEEETQVRKKLVAARRKK